MLKKLTAKQDQKIEAEARAQFATDVINLYHAKMERSEDTHPDPDVRAVACGLAALKQAIDPVLQRHQHNPEVLIRTGAAAANEIINALTTTGRRDHPLWKHICSLQTSLHLATPGAQQRRTMFAGIALAYQEAAGGDLRPATVAVSASINAPDFPVNAEQLRQWVRRNEKAARVHAKRFLADAKALGGPAGSLPHCVIIVGRKAMKPLLVIPS